MYAVQFDFSPFLVYDWLQKSQASLWKNKLHNKRKLDEKHLHNWRYHGSW